MQMKSKRYFSYVALPFAVAMACGAVGTAKAAATANLEVTAHVAPSCIISVTKALAFGEYDTNATVDLLGEGTVSTTCTNGSSAVITLSEGLHADEAGTGDAPLRQMMANGVDLLGYQLYQDTGHDEPWGLTETAGKDAEAVGTPVAFTVYGVVPAGQIVKEGAYSDTVVATVTF